MKRKILSSKSIPEFQESLDNMPAESKIFVDKSLAIAHYIQLIMQHQRIRQKDLAELMGKTEAEVSKWLAGMHNYTLRSLAKIEAALGSDIICIPDKIVFSSPEITENIKLRISRKYNQTQVDSSNIDYLSQQITPNTETKQEDKTEHNSALAA